MKIARFTVPPSDKALQGRVFGEVIETEADSFPLSEVDLLPPVEPTKIICVGLNYRKHIEETESEPPERPSLFLKPTSAIIGDNDPIRITSEDRFDPEGEIAVVIGKNCYKIQQTNAENYIWGYTGLNDVTNRNAQSWEQNWIRAKGFDTAAPIGPYLVTPEELDKPIQFQLTVNGEVRQSADTSQLIFNASQLIEEISSFMTLNRGDVISTGTPEGIGPIHSGDEIKLEIKGIGTLTNPVVGINEY